MSRWYNLLVAKTLILFIGLILRNEIFLRTKKLRLLKNGNKNYTISNCLTELSCIQAVNVDGKDYINERALSTTQKNILTALEISESKLNGYLTKFNREIFSIKRWEIKDKV